MSTSRLQSFLPPDRGRSFAPPARAFSRACVAHVVARAVGQSAADVARGRWADDAPTLAMLTRGVAVPAATSVAGWASELAAKSVGDFVLSLEGSAASRVFQAGLSVDMQGRNEVKVPRLGSALPVVNFIDEGQPGPVIQVTIGDATLAAPSKLLVFAGFSEELARSSAAETVIGTILKAAVGRSLDAALFFSVAGSSSRPPGLLSGVVALTPTAGGGQPAAENDLVALLAALTTAGAVSMVLIAGPRASASLRLRFPDLPFEVWPSPAVATDTVIALDPSNIATGFSSEPRIEASREALVHYEDALPLAIGTPGAPPTVASPSRSAFQTNTIVLKVTLATSWTAIETGRVAVVNSITWA